MMAPDRDPRLGIEVDRYTIVRLLGKGGMGAVYEARHSRLARRVAIKFLLPELAARPEILRRFENEAMAAGGLEHPNLVAVMDLGRAAEGSPYLVMEFLQGEDCARLLRRVGPLPVPRAADIVLQACRGVAVAHQAGIIHRDLKPENLFVTDIGDGSDQVKVLDFGIAKLRLTDGQVATRTGSTFGTIHYMSPEQARGAAEVDPRTDVWSLGVVLYELLGGHRPFEGDEPLNVVHQILSANPPALDTFRPGLPAGLVAVVGKAIQKDAGERFQSVGSLAAALAPFAGRTTMFRDLASPPAMSTRPTPATTAEHVPGRRSVGWRRVGTVLALAGVAVVTASIISARRKPPPPAATATGLPSASPGAHLAPASPLPVSTPPSVKATERVAVLPDNLKVSEPSGHSEQPGHSGQSSTARARRRPAGDSHASIAVPQVAAGKNPDPGHPADSAKPSINLDPNPY
jgi:serine/threonine protein kinase